MHINGRPESDSDFVKTKVNDDYIKTFSLWKESVPFLLENALRDCYDPDRIRICYLPVLCFLIESDITLYYSYERPDETLYLHVTLTDTFVPHYPANK